MQLWFRFELVLLVRNKPLDHVSSKCHYGFDAKIVTFRNVRMVRCSGVLFVVLIDIQNSFHVTYIIIHDISIVHNIYYVCAMCIPSKVIAFYFQTF